MSQQLTLRSTLRLRLLVVALAAALLPLGLQRGGSARGLTDLPLYDYVAFWAAGRLNQTGHDPFDTDRLAVIEREAVPGQQDVLVMWSAPWTLSFVMPFSFFDARSSRLFWMLFQFLVLVAGVEIAWRVYGGSAEQRWLAWLLAFTFLPSYILLVTGQIGALLLLGLAGFLYALKQGREVWAGVFLAAAALKPQLTYLFWIVLLLWAWERRSWRLVLGGGLAVLAALAWPLWDNPGLLGHYGYALTHRTQTHAHLSPLPGVALLLLLGRGHFGPLQFLPVIPGLIWMTWYWRKHRRTWDWERQMPPLLFASFLTTSYGAWPFDLVVLLLPVLQLATEMARQGRVERCLPAAIAYLTISSIAVVQLVGQVEYFWFIWMTPTLLLAYLAFRPRAAASLV